MAESDADWSGDVNDGKSATGYYFKLNGRGAALSWVVKKQATVALSSSATSGGFRHPKETSNGNRRGQPELY